MDEMIPAAQAAEILGVTDARIRQLTAAERITGHVYGPRVVLYNRAEIEVYKRMTGGAEVTSGIAATAPTLDEPLRLNDDTVLNIPIPNALGDTNIHVRIWKSDRRTLVLVAPVAGSTIAVDGWHFEEYILPTVSDTFLHGDSLTPIGSRPATTPTTSSTTPTRSSWSTRPSRKNPPAGAHCGTAAPQVRLHRTSRTRRDDHPQGRCRRHRQTDWQHTVLPEQNLATPNASGS
ncbi:hypothetical protein GS528_28110 [Rhodococcus hoagii]|nr:hypothetical protein [Prescottella equi]